MMLGMRLGEFTRHSLERHCEGDSAIAVGRALSQYHQRREAGKAMPPPPSFLPDAGGQPFNLDVDADLAAALARDAREQRVPVEALLRHAVLVYLAEIDRAPPPSR